MLPSNLEIRASLPGILAISMIPAASYALPSTTPPLISSFSAVLAKLASSLAGAVASVVEIAIALGPSRYGASASKSVPLNAKFIIVFLYTL